MDIKEKINAGKTSLGIELGSTRIKAVLLDGNNTILALGDYAWESRYINKIWTYTLEDIWTGIQTCFKNLCQDVNKQYGIDLIKIGSIGISAMMHGYMVFDKNGEMLTSFRTWRNNNAENAAAELSKLFDYNIPARWSIAHLYQAVLDNEEHISRITYQTTLEGYIHWKLTGKKVIGIGEASGMFPVDVKTKQYNKKMVAQFNKLDAVKKMPWTLEKIMPEILLAGDNAGSLTPEGARLLDISGKLKAGVPFCPPEGDAGTGMVATNSVKKCTGNISAGTSIFGMIVLEKELSRMYPEIDLLTTPVGDLVAMVHCNNCSSEIDAWVKMFGEFADLMGVKADKSAIYNKLYNKSLEGDADCGGMIVYNYLSGENITGIDEGRPMVVRTTESKFNLANFLKAQLYSTMATLKIGLDILKNEKVKISSIYGHGGIFKVKGVCQGYLAAMLDAPVTVMETAGEGGAWGMALLASYMVNKKAGESLESFLADTVFTGRDAASEILPDSKTVKGFDRFMASYKSGLAVVKEAVKKIKPYKKEGEK